MTEYWYDWNRKYVKKFRDPEYQCTAVTKKGKRCKRMTTTCFCEQHANTSKQEVADDPNSGYNIKQPKRIAQ